MKPTKLSRAYRWFIRNWNALLAAISLAFVVVFNLIPPLQAFAPVFYFAVANAIVWTLIEIKVLLRSTEHTDRKFTNLRQARSSMLTDLEHGLRRSSRDNPLKVTFSGGRIRSMSEVIREFIDDLESGRSSGHVEIVLSTIASDFLEAMVLPGTTTADAQRLRNRRVAQSVESTVAELEQRGNFDNGRASCKFTVARYQSEPTMYGLLIPGIAVYWGPYTWSSATSDWVGPENSCLRYSPTATGYELFRSWIENRTQLNLARTTPMSPSDLGQTNVG